jgi:multidrug efflux system membrane fusion protein
VRTRTFVAEPRIRDVVLRGRIEASRWVDVKAETTGRVVGVPVRKGAKIRANDVIVELSLENREPRLAEAKALVQQREMEHSAAVQLNERGFRPPTKVAETAALLESARARQSEIEIDIRNTKIRAPFNGVVELRPVEVGEIVNRNTVVARLIDQDPFLVVGQIAERDVAHVKVGDPGRARLASGDMVDGKVRYIATAADERTRTFRIEIEVPARAASFRDGITADIFLAADRQMAHRISPAILTLNDAGELGVRAVVAGDTVKFHPVQILDDTADGVWIAGLPERVDIIVVGQEFAREGGKVRAVTSSAP